MPPSHSPDQYLIDFTSQDHDARRMLRAALKQTPGAKLEHWDLLWWIRNVETEKHGLKKTADEIAEQLWCSAKSVRRFVSFLVENELVSIIEHHAYTGSQQANEYCIDWDGVRKRYASALSELGIKVQRPREGQSVPPGGQTDHPPVQTDHPPGQTDQGGGQNDHRIKETLSLLNLSEYSGTGAGALGPNPSQGKPAKGRLLMPSPHDWLRSAGLQEIPELAEGADLRIEPLPPSRLVYGPWAVIEDKHLDHAPSLIEWLRRQASIASPVCGDTEADLLLVLAAGLEAIRIPSSEVRKTRVAIFVNTVSREIWRPVLKHISKARKTLDALAAQKGHYWRVAEVTA